MLPAEANTTDPRSVWRHRTVVSTFLIRLHSTAPRVGLRVWSILRKRQPVLAVSASHPVQPICRCHGCPSFADRLSSECRLTLCDSVVSLCLRLKLRTRVAAAQLHYKIIDSENFIKVSQNPNKVASDTQGLPTVQYNDFGGLNFKDLASKYLLLMTLPPADDEKMKKIVLPVPQLQKRPRILHPCRKLRR